jgi:hypothetical protein
MERFGDVMKFLLIDFRSLISLTKWPLWTFSRGEHISHSPPEKMPSRPALSVETIGRNQEEDWTLADSAGFLWTFPVLALFPKMEAPLFAGTPVPLGF